jgi:hypothetical protein
MDGQIYATQDNLKLSLQYDVLPTNTESVVIKYRTPNEEEGFFTNSVHDSANKIVYYIPEVGDPLGVVGPWTFWLYFTLTDGRVHPSTPTELNVLDEGYSE